MSSVWTDGIHKELRELQREFFSQFERDRRRGIRTFAIRGAPGTGKSLIIQALINHYGAGHVICPNNSLVDQAKARYPWVNTIKGKHFYSCNTYKLSCGDIQERFDRPPCKGCPYTESRSRARQGDPTYWNPVSFLFGNPRLQPITVVDEVHKLPGMLLEFCGGTFNKVEYNVDTNLRDDMDVLAWLKRCKAKLKEMVDKAFRDGNKDILTLYIPRYERVYNLLESFREKPQRYFHYYEGTTLHVKPLDIPPRLINKFRQSLITVLVSATITQREIDLFKTGEVSTFEAESPIPTGNVNIHYEPVGWKIADTNDADKVAYWIASRVSGTTLCHVSYRMANALKPRLEKLVPGVITHKQSARDKEAALVRFKKKGGLFLASGFDEGVDLPGDQCQTLLIPQIQRADVGSRYVQKMLGLPGGRDWYASESISNTVQRIGRGTRNEDDRLEVFIGDPTLPKLLSKYPKDWPPHIKRWLV